MNFREALKEMEKGGQVCLPDWKGYLFMDKEGLVLQAGSDDVSEREWMLDILDTRWERKMRKEFLSIDDRILNTEKSIDELEKKAGRLQAAFSTIQDQSRKIGSLEAQSRQTRDDIMKISEAISAKTDKFHSDLETVIQKYSRETQMVEKERKDLEKKRAIADRIINPPPEKIVKQCPYFDCKIQKLIKHRHLDPETIVFSDPREEKKEEKIAVAESGVSEAKEENPKPVKGKKSGKRGNSQKV